MALSQVYTAVAGHTITADRWNNEFGNIYNNGTDVAFPLTKAVSFAGYTITWDAAAVTTISSSASQAWQMTPGAKSGTPSTTGGLINVVASTYTDNNTAGSGTATAFAAHAFQRPTLAATNASVVTTDAATVYIANSPANGTNETITNPWAIWVDAGHTRLDGNLRVDGELLGAISDAGMLFGLTLSNNGSDATNDIDIAVGEASSTHATPSSRVRLRLSSALTKRLDASWATGTNQGGLSSSLTISNTTYYVHVIRVAGVDDVGFDTSATAANLITDHSATHYRRIGFIIRTAGAIVAFTQDGDLFWRNTPVLDVDVSTAGTSAVLRTMSLPTGTSWVGLFNVYIQSDASNDRVYISDPATVDLAPSASVSPLGTVEATNGTANNANCQQIICRTNTSAQIRTRNAAGADANDILRIATLGWYDYRGRNA